jgi:hypothetical protein
MAGFDVEKEKAIWGLTIGAFLDHFDAMLQEATDRKRKTPVNE